MFRALRVRNFRIYASANLVSLTGTWMQRIGQDWLVLQLSGDSGVALGLITALQFGPTLLLSMYGGVLGDRYAKRRVLVITQALMGVLALVLGILVATGGVALWHVFVLAAGLGAVSAIDAPVRQAFVSEMVGPGLLANAVSLNSTIFNGARLVGPAVAGLIIGGASGNTAPAFLINAASFAFTIGALLSMRPAELRPSPPVARANGQLRAGVAYTWAHPDLVLAMALAFLIGTFGFNYQVTIALMARERFDLGAEAFGLLSTFFAVGSLTGALLSTPALPGHLGGRVRPAHRRRRAHAHVRVVRGAVDTHRSCRPGVQRRQQQLRPARCRAPDARPGDGALLHVLHGGHAHRSTGGRLDLRALRRTVGTHPRRRHLRGRRADRGRVPGARPPGAARGRLPASSARAAGRPARRPVASAARGGRSRRRSCAGCADPGRLRPRSEYRRAIP
jgi:MFS family permease